jgi:hypothetical protein
VYHLPERGSGGRGAPEGEERIAFRAAAQAAESPKFADRLCR